MELEGKAEIGLKEGQFLLGFPTYTEIENGRFRCNETGHELPGKDREVYGRSKACRLKLIDSALLVKKPPLNMFRQDPNSKSKIVCLLTGDTINKSEEHIWKHINGKRFQNKLEKKEEEKRLSKESLCKDEDEDVKKKKKLKKEKKNVSHKAQDADCRIEEEEPNFWVPPIGNRWDFDNGKDRWGPFSNSDGEVDESTPIDKEENEDDVGSEDLSTRAKRMPIAVGPSSFASRKKKIKKASTVTEEN